MSRRFLVFGERSKFYLDERGLHSSRLPYSSSHHRKLRTRRQHGVQRRRRRAVQEGLQARQVRQAQRRQRRRRLGQQRRPRRWGSRRWGSPPERRRRRRRERWRGRRRLSGRQQGRRHLEEVRVQLCQPSFIFTRSFRAVLSSSWSAAHTAARSPSQNRLASSYFLSERKARHPAKLKVHPLSTLLTPPRTTKTKTAS
jgi:hypothetical protein